ncbi:hypothetical protein [Streptomyces sp. NBC_00102]|uniref:hypothetical protein n=1 Tax=Streptomyces sp. NBC_00102 TaxID=2975652 RepID=UPI00225843BD|nr:hypothetical protein [Streptomyces sp. NBC_00102]MCX5398055.1 hypothetical protein [Streptomyces sp. NBC_00102]
MIPLICVDCDRTITGPAVITAEGHSASGARPDAYAHPSDSPDCRPPARSRGHRIRKALAESQVQR